MEHSFYLPHNHTCLCLRHCVGIFAALWSRIYLLDDLPYIVASYLVNHFSDLPANFGFCATEFCSTHDLKKLWGRTFARPHD